MNDGIDDDRFRPLDPAEIASAPVVSPTEDRAARIEKARALVQECVPIDDTPAAAYLATRSIAPDKLPRSVVGWHQPSAAILFVARDADDHVTGVQRVFLNADGTAKVEADGRKKKRSNGVLKGAAMGLPGEGAEVLVTEGPEDALSLWQATDQSVRCAFGAHGLAEVPLPAGAVVVLVADNDRPDSPVHDAIAKSVSRLADRGFKVKVACPPHGIKDTNDLVRELGIEAVRTMVAGAAPMKLPPADIDLSLIRTGRRQAPHLPLEVFESFWAEWASTAAEGAGAPIDYVVAGLLAAASAALGNARWVSPWAGWKEPPILWIGIVGSPSSNKSPGLDPALGMLRVLEGEMADGFEEKNREWLTARESATVAREKWEKEVRAAHKAGNPPPIIPTAAVEPAEPVRPRIIANDATSEKLGLLAAAHPKGLLHFRDELSGWLGSFDKYGGAGGDRALWLEAYGGRPYVIDRVKHPLPIRIPNLSVAVLGGIQPDKLAILLSGPDDGLPSRLLWSWPEPLPPRRPQRTPDTEAALLALRRLKDLALVPSEDGSGGRPAIVLLADDAAAFFQEWRVQHDEGQRGVAGGLASAWGKAPGQLLRLALILEHLWWCADPSCNLPARVTVKAVAAAAALITEYFLPMAARTYGDAALPEGERLAVIVAHWIIKNRPAVINARALRRQARLPGLSDAAKVKLALEALVDAGWIKAVEAKGEGRPRGDFVVNPMLWALINE